MDEMTQLRGLRADAPAPDRARLAAGRQRLTEATAKRSRTRALRTDWRLASLGAAAAAVVTILIGVQLQSPGSGDGPSPAASTVITVPDLDDPVALLNRIADAAEARPDPNPKPGQWVYEKSVRGHESGDNGGLDTGPQESWYPYVDPEFENGSEGDDYSFRLRYEAVADLPDDPDKLFAKLREMYPSGGYPEPRTAHNYRAARVLVGTWPVPPEGIARVYRALATLEGVAAVDHLVTSATGQKAIAVYVKGGDMRSELLFDPHTLEPVGGRTVVVKEREYDEEYPGDPPKKGDVLINSAVLEHAMVGREGERP